MRLTFALLFLLLFNSLSQGQSPAPHLREAKFDFGEIAEENGRVYHTFQIENQGNDTIWWESVKGNCHCTTGEFISDFIAPGKTGLIRVIYDPKGRPWPFEALLDVKVKGIEKLSLKLTGTVSRGKKQARFTPSEYVQKFDFNEKAIETSKVGFEGFVKSLLPLLERHGDIKIAIESSASKVPTKLYSGNEELTKARATSARNEMLRILHEAGAMENRIQFDEVKSLVQGPEFQKDYQKNPERYAPYQYVKIRVY